YRSYKPLLPDTDDYWMVDNYREEVLNSVCSLRSEENGIEMEIRSSQPALYVSSCSSIEGCGTGSNGEELKEGCAVLLAPMAVANGANENLILRVGQHYHHYTTYNFKNL
ncbi:MAG: hypothetical protein RR550_04610, partial [Rikenellaceae bacterium]